MTTDEIKAALHRIAADVRAPKFQRASEVGLGEATSPQKRIEMLEEFMETAAIARADLEQGVLIMDQARFQLEGQWDAIDGWRQVLGDLAAKATGPQIVRAKREINPEVYDGLREAKWLLSRLHAQIRRLEKDEESTSRRYTILTGS